MTAPACGSCGAPVADARLCTGCTRDLAKLLLQAASIAPDLDDAVAKLLKRGAGGKRGDENPLPVDLAASEAATRLHDCLVFWAWQLHHGTIPASVDRTPAGLARHLATRLADLRQHKHAASAHREIRERVHRALAVIDRPAERVPAGLCDNCGRQLLAELGADQVQCACGMTVLALQDKRRERAAAADVLGTPAAIHDALKTIGIDIPRGTITSWVSRHRIALRPGNVIALSDVLALHAQSQQKVRR